VNTTEDHPVQQLRQLWDGSRDSTQFHEALQEKISEALKGKTQGISDNSEDSMRFHEALKEKLSDALKGKSKERTLPKTYQIGNENIPPKTYHIVGSMNDWIIPKEPMRGPQGASLRYRIIVRESAPDSPEKAGGKSLKREEFQILGDGVWSKRLYPDGGDHEEVIVLKPGMRVSHAVGSESEGHGRNWAIDGIPGSAFDIIFDPRAQIVTCEKVPDQITPWSLPTSD